MTLLSEDVALPACVAARVDALNAVVRERGLGDAAPETVALVETLFRYLGSLWVAEYVHAGAFDERLNRDLFDSLERPVLTGQWVSFGSRIRELFVERGVSVVIVGLDAVDFGDPADTAHPVTSLLRYRAHFAHGGFGVGPAEAADAHSRLRTLLDDASRVLSEVPRFRVGGQLRRADRAFDLAGDAPGADVAELQPFLLDEDGRAALELYPLLYVRHDPEDGSFELRFGESRRNAPHSNAQLLDREVLALYAARYAHERAGHVDSEPELRDRCRTDAAPSALDELKALLGRDGWQLALLEAHPGCGAPHALLQLSALAPRGAFARVAHFVVAPGDLGQSGEVFARFLLRQVEAALSLEPGVYDGRDEAVLITLERAKADLDATGQRILVGLLDLHHGLEPYRGETLSVADVYRRLDGGPIQVVASLLPGHPRLLDHPLAWDVALTLPVLEPGRLDTVEVLQALEELAPPPPKLHRRILALLSEQDRPRTLHELCDDLEARGGDVLTPEVERTLAELTPLLRVSHRDSEEAFTLYSPIVRALEPWK